MSTGRWRGNCWRWIGAAARGGRNGGPGRCWVG